MAIEFIISQGPYSFTIIKTYDRQNLLRQFHLRQQLRKEYYPNVVYLWIHKISLDHSLFDILQIHSDLSFDDSLFDTNITWNNLNDITLFISIHSHGCHCIHCISVFLCVISTINLDRSFKSTYQSEILVFKNTQLYSRGGVEFYLLYSNHSDSSNCSNRRLPIQIGF